MAPRSSTARPLIAAAWLALLASACGGGATPRPDPASSSASAASSAMAAPSALTASAVEERLRSVEGAEQRRVSSEITAGDLAARDVRLRRAAARALSRIADARAAELLLVSLGDEDPSVISWSAYGLGSACQGHEGAHSRALAARAASLLVGEASTIRAPAARGPLLEPLASIADGLGRCGGADAERTLRAWVASGGSLAEPAGWALGVLASRTDRLDDASLVALLDAAGRAEAPVESALQAFTRLSHLDETVRARLHDVARRGLAGSGLRRSIAVRALAATGASAATPLEGVLRGAAFTPAERADAVRGLARLGPDGQRVLGDGLGPLADEVLGHEGGLLAPSYGVLAAALASLGGADRAGPALAGLAALEVGTTAPLRRRSVALRCGAASVLAGRGTESSVLAECDPDKAGRAGRLAMLRVLDHGPLRGQRGRLFRALAVADDATVRERALELLATHPELEQPGELVAAALGRKSPGDVATAARLVADHPERVALSATVADPDPRVTQALGLAIGAFARSPSVEVRAALADASGALALLGAKPVLEADCQSDNPTLRKHAEKALRALGNREQHCDAWSAAKDTPAELLHPLAGTTRLELETDAGTVSIELSPELSPVASTRLVELARAGFYDGIVVHRVVPGFVVQLGDREGDGYGGVDRPPLRCETSPSAFEAGSVGIALSGRDTGSSQFFVTLAREPHLDGEYALVGRTGPGWERLTEGDIVTKVTVR